ncbi:Ribulose-5-phosphate 4-epimerase/Fuculose-1-phosphate aldolase [Lampropedia hyalina DSM 16112]|jgi:ribulose-5-phosphate 4-epimerase/fuculose-1-phosphate aldolase|uniref:Ribulose-5-phosphate 4-epimerase/Fuculose-1-phosphate aldolase n=1 Tax=Lampropedia hyalina DSM 16112 TaxID=1122156 RepID=A0A1M4YA17_9BURK|nr:class II aldolase/adducin family protein [Lampropedia hyalina]SHF02489.1 Ribulose-5-phosphate 4-epimerase/Fuculose-1-phosphate aldolase [Lampropedia hyalina DSM 16112]
MNAVIEEALRQHTDQPDYIRTASGLVLKAQGAQKFWFDPQPPRATVQEERQYRRTRLAAAFRIFAQHGFDHGLAGHITVRDPELHDHFWVNPLGLHFSRIRVSDLLLVNARGETVVGERPLNKAAFAIHAAIHEVHPQLVAAAHTHSTYGKAWSALGRTLEPLTQDSCVFYEDHALFDDFTGMVVDTSEGERIAHALRKPAGGLHKGVILRNHGILTAGPSLEAAAWWYIALENACQAQLLAQAAGQPVPIDHATAHFTHSQIGGTEGAIHAFHSLYEGLVAAEPDVLN